MAILPEETALPAKGADASPCIKAQGLRITKQSDKVR